MLVERLSCKQQVAGSIPAVGLMEPTSSFQKHSQTSKTPIGTHERCNRDTASASWALPVMKIKWYEVLVAVLIVSFFAFALAARR